MENDKKTPDLQEQKLMELLSEIKSLRNEIIGLIEALNKNTKEYVDLINSAMATINRLINYIILNKS